MALKDRLFKIKIPDVKNTHQIIKTGHQKFSL